MKNEMNDRWYPLYAASEPKTGRRVFATMLRFDGDIEQAFDEYNRLFDSETQRPFEESYSLEDAIAIALASDALGIVRADGGMMLSSEQCQQLREQKIVQAAIRDPRASHSSFEDIWLYCLHHGVLRGKLRSTGYVAVETMKLIVWADDQKRWPSVTPPDVGNLLSGNRNSAKRGMGFKKVRVMDDGYRGYFWQIPPLDVARAAWNSARYRVNWPDDDGIWRVV